MNSKEIHQLDYYFVNPIVDYSRDICNVKAGFDVHAQGIRQNVQDKKTILRSSSINFNLT